MIKKTVPRKSEKIANIKWRQPNNNESRLSPYISAYEISYLSYLSSHLTIYGLPRYLTSLTLPKVADKTSGEDCYI